MSNNIENKDFYQRFFLASIIGILNLLTYKNFLLSIIFVTIEILILLYLLILNKSTDYICFFMIALCLSFEFPDLVGSEVFFGFKNFEFFGLNLGIIFLLPLFTCSFFHFTNLNRLKVENKYLYRFFIIIMFLSVSGIFIGAFLLLFNDNGINNLQGFLNEFIKYAYKMVCIPVLVLFNSIYILKKEKKQIYKVKNTLLSILLANCIMLILSFLLEIRGAYGGNKTLLVSSTNIFLPFLLLIFLYEKNNIVKKGLIFLLTIIGICLSLVFNASGKIFLTLGLILLYYCIYLFSKIKKRSAIIMLCIFPAIILTALIVINQMTMESSLFTYKLQQAVGILKIWEKDWLMSMPASPRFRIVEFIDVLYEYIDKPWQAIFGKGYLGTTRNLSGLIYFHKDAFSDLQWEYSLFFSLHETLNKLFLNHGFTGIAVFIYMIWQMIKNCLISPWIVVGTFWFVLIYGYSVTMSVFGIISLVYAYYEIEEKKQKAKSNELF